MKKYEAIFILRPTLGEEEMKEAVERFKNFIETNATIETFDEWGNRKLAYTIEDHNEGYYIFTTFEALPTFPQQLERLFRISEDVIKFIVVKKDR